MASINCISSYLSGQFAGSSSVFFFFFFFCKAKLQSRQKGRAATQMDRSSTSTEIVFHGLPSKSKHPSIRKQIASLSSSQLIVLLLLRNSHLQRDIQQTFFHQYFCENSCSTLKNRSENFKKVHKITPPVAKSYLSKVAGFYRSNHLRCSVKKVFLERCSQISQENTCV